MALRYQEVKENVRNTVLGLKAGSKIPSRVFLSRKYQAARNTIDKAISELEKEGYLYSVKGSGTFVLENSAKKVLNIGVILPSIVDDMYPQFISGIEQYASGNNINVVLSSSENFPEKQHANILRMSDIRADGCIMIPVINSELSYSTFAQFQKTKIPFVICSRSIDGLDIPFISINNNYGAYIATKHLIEQGCRKLAYISEKKYSTAMERYHGFETAICDSFSGAKKKRRDFWLL